MKFLEKRGIALAVLVLAIAAAVFIGQSRKAGYIENQPVTLPEVQYRQWICDEAGMLSETTKDAIRQYNDNWDSRYYAVIAVATADNITGWTPEEAAQKLGADWGLAANDMLLLMVRGDDYYVACGDNVLAALNSYDTMLARLKQAIEDPYYNGDFDGAALAFYRQADVFYGQAQMGSSGGSTDTQHSSRHAGRSSAVVWGPMVRCPPETAEQTGRIMVRSITLAPTMLPTDMEASFFAMAVRVVTSSGKEVPMATMVTPMMLEGTPSSSASSPP